MSICVRVGFIAYVDATATMVNVYLCQDGSQNDKTTAITSVADKLGMEQGWHQLETPMDPFASSK